MAGSRLMLVSGKGGTGKSAVAAGIALLAQRQGDRVLAMEVDDDGSLSSHFATTPFDFEPREVRPGLHAMRISRPDALLEYLSLQLRIPGVGRFGGRIARAFDALATAAPAVREIITIGKVYWEVKSGRWDTVVVDAPPTGQIGEGRDPKACRAYFEPFGLAETGRGIFPPGSEAIVATGFSRRRGAGDIRRSWDP